MDNRNSHSEYDSRYNSNYDANYGTSDGHYDAERYGEYNRPMEYEIFGEMTYRDRGDYYGGDGRNDYALEDPGQEYKKELEEWIKKMKSKDRFQLSKQEVLNKAKQMGVKFEEFSEEEFYATYLAMITDYKNVGNDPHIYLSLAKQFLEDDDIELSPSEKVYAYLNYIVLGKALKENEV